MAQRRMIPDTAQELSTALETPYWTQAEELVAAIEEPSLKRSVTDRLGVSITRG